jgi:protein-L-isoaspartate(D-aspartate) O-methyltransferase
MSVKLPVDRRQFVIGAVAEVAALAARPAPSAYDSSASPPRQSRGAFVEWMVKNRGEDAKFLGQRWDRLRFSPVVAPGRLSA